ncbi:MAG: hypothetical protein J5871_02120 [Bacteroidales bacterium]|nr:hypothetical protein [Bacteroidales bacterium]
MKRVGIFALTGAILLAGCHKETIENVENETIVFHINTTAPGLDTDTAETKASAKAQIKLTWDNGDAVSVVNLTTGKTLGGDLTASVNGERVSFDGHLIGAVRSGDQLAAIYPSQGYKEAVAMPDFTFDLATQNCSSKEDVAFCAYSLFTCEVAGEVSVTSRFIVPISFSQIAVSGLEPDTAINYIELTRVGTALTFHLNSGKKTLDMTPQTGTVRITPTAANSNADGAFFAWCALAESPAADRTITVKALPNIYTGDWAKSAMAGSKYYTSIATGFSKQEYRDFLVMAPKSLELDYRGGTVRFLLSSKNIPWNVSTSPAVSVAPSAGSTCENLEVCISVPENTGTTTQKYLVMVKGDETYQYLISQHVNPERQIVEIPDIHLKSYMLALFDDDEDGEISIEEAQYVQNVNCSGCNVTDLSGLEQCPNLKYLNFSDNSVTDVILPDLQKLETLVAYGNPIEKLILNRDTALSTLYLRDVSTNALDNNTILIQEHPTLKKLYFAFAETRYTQLKILDCSLLEELDVTENTQLKWFQVRQSPLLTAVDVTPLTALTYLGVYRCGLTALNIDANINIDDLDCSRNAISALSVDNNVKLTRLVCDNNKLSKLRVSSNTELEKLYCGNNALLNLTVRALSKLQTLDIADNAGITAISLLNNPALVSLNAARTSLTDIDVTANPALKNLNLSGCTAMHIVNALDLTANTQLETLDVSYSSVSALDLTANTVLKYLYVDGTYPEIIGLHASASVVGVGGVDMGLSVKWATYNVGAFAPEEYGAYFAWGETTPKATYSWSTYKYSNGDNDTLTKYCNNSSYGYNGYTDYKTVLDLGDDAARVNWGGNWRMPTDAEWTELRNTSNCTWTWTTLSGVNGMKVTSKKTGNSIFLPAAGSRKDSSLGGAGSFGHYWSSSRYTNSPSNAYYVSFNSSGVYGYNTNRCYGQSVRPVIK